MYPVKLSFPRGPLGGSVVGNQVHFALQDSTMANRGRCHAPKWVLRGTLPTVLASSEAIGRNSIMKVMSYKKACSAGEEDRGKGDS